MAETPDPNGGTELSLAEQWEREQASWRQLMLSYVDAAAQDEQFLTHIGNAMRGSLLAGKPYPGTTGGAAAPTPEPPSNSSDELVFAVRRLEGRISELVQVVDQLQRRFATAGDDAPVAR